MTILYNLSIKPLIYLIELAFSVSYRLLGNAGLAVVAVSAFINILILPLYQTADKLQMEERNRTKEMENWVDHIKKNFKGDEQYMMLSTYYREQGYKPIYALRSSVSLLLQIPFFIAAYRYLSSLEILKGAMFLGITNLGAPDQMLHAGGITLNLLPVLMTVLNLASGSVYTKGLDLKDKLQTYGLALLFLVLLYKSPSGLVLYWTCNQVFSLFKNVFMRVSPEKAKILKMTLGIMIPLTVFILWRAKIIIHGPVRLTFIVVLTVLLEALLLYTPKDGVHDYKDCNRLFLIGGVLLTVLLGVLIPSSFIGSSPTEFFDITDYVSPMKYVVNTTSVAAGIFIVWMGVFYYLSSPKKRYLISRLTIILSICAFITFLFFGKNLGIVTTSLVFENTPEFSKSEMMLNLMALAVIITVILLLDRLHTSVLFPTVAILVLAALGTSVPNLAAIKRADSDARSQIEESQENTNAVTSKLFDENGQIIPTVHLSKSGKNVVVLFVDRGISGYLPYMLEERPDLAEALAGFVYYPNTVSYGPRTVFSSSSIMGGYDYTLEAMNERKDELLVDKHNEAAQLLPYLFEEQDYKVSLLSEPLVDYQLVATDYSLFDKYKNVTAYHAAGVYNDVAFADMNQIIADNFDRNLFFYSVFKCAPVALQSEIYDDGTYWTTLVNHSINSEFMEYYSTLCVLDDLTYIDDDYSGSYVHLHTLTTHTPDIMQLPDYEPALYLNDYPEDMSRFTLNGRTVLMDTRERLAHYHAFVATFQKLCSWFDYLKSQGVWDNTRVIIVSDHGYELGQFEDLIYDDSLDIEMVNPLFLVKDFNDDTEIRTDDSFMTTADTAWMALDGIVKNPINPFTGNPIDESPKSHDQVITSSVIWDVRSHHKGSTFDTDDGHFYSVHDNIFDMNNWKRLD